MWVKLKALTVALWPKLRFIMTHKVTYRFLFVVLGALGYSHAGELSDTLQSIAMALFGPLQ